MRTQETMTLPNNSVVIPKNEMRYLDGGVALNVKKAHLNKSTCKTLGAKYASQVGLSKMRIAKEIYAHAVAYYASPAVLASYAAMTTSYLGGIIGRATASAALNYIRSHANPINLGGDPAIRVKIYNALWAIL